MKALASLLRRCRQLDTPRSMARAAIVASLLAQTLWFVFASPPVFGQSGPGVVETDEVLEKGVGGLGLTGTSSTDLALRDPSGTGSITQLSGNNARVFQELSSVVTCPMCLVGYTSYTPFSSATFWYQNAKGGWKDADYVDSGFSQEQAVKLNASITLMTWALDQHMGELMSCAAQNTAGSIPERYQARGVSLVPALDVTRLTNDLRALFRPRGNRTVHIAIGAFDNPEVDNAIKFGVTWSDPLDSRPKGATDLSNLASLKSVLIGINQNQNADAQDILTLGRSAGNLFHEILHNFGFGHGSNALSAYQDRSKALFALEDCLCNIVRDRVLEGNLNALSRGTAWLAPDGVGQEVACRDNRQSSATPPQPTPGPDPMAAAVRIISDAAKQGDMATVEQAIMDAEAFLGLTLPGRTFAEICWYGSLAGQASQVLTYCDEAVRRLPDDADARDKRGLARALTGDTSGAAEDFAFFVQQLDPQVSSSSTSEAAERLRIRQIWILQLIDGQFPFDAAVLDDLSKVERDAPWVSNETGQIYYASGSARPRTVVYAAPSSPTKPQEPATGAAQPGGSTGSSAQPAPPAPAVAVATTITDFEKWSAWRRGDETWGTFGQSGEQHRSGKSSGKLSYDFPAGEADNYVVFLRTLPIAGKPDALRAQVYGDGSTHFLNAWVQDATGQAWQFTFGRIYHTGWQEMVAPLDLSLGWPNQAVGDTTSTAPAFPIKLSALVLDGYTSDQAFTGDVYVDDLEAITYQGTDETGSTETGVASAPTQERATINSASLNVRSGPGTSYGVVAKVRRGETYPILGRDVATGWVQIAVPAAASGAGWVSGQYVTITTTGPSSSPGATGGTGAASPPASTTPSQPTTSPATGSAAPVNTPTTTGPGAGQASLVTDFESFGTWQRGDEAWGTFTQSADQSRGGQYAGKISYDFPAGEPNNYVVFRRTLPIKGQPTALRMQVLGDGSTHFLNTWVQDAKGQLWQFSFGRIDHQGWQAMEAPLDPSLGWPNQAIGHSATSIAYPIKLYALVLDGYTSDQAFTGSIYVDDLEAISQ